MPAGKALWLLLLFFISGYPLAAAENDKMDDESEYLERINECNHIHSTSIRIKSCRLVPDTGELLQCGAYFRKRADSTRYPQTEAADRNRITLYERRAEKAWKKGEKIMLARKTPDSKKQICGQYLQCFRRYIESLPDVSPDGRPLHHEQYGIRKRYDEINAFCDNDIYTITLRKKKAEEKSPGFKRWRGKGNHSRITTQESKQVIFVKPRQGRIVNVPLKKYATSFRTTERYLFDSHACQFILKTDDEKNKHIDLAPVYVYPSDKKGRMQFGFKFDSGTTLNLEISSIKPTIELNWGAVQNFKPTFFKKATYIAKNTLPKESPIKVPGELKQIMTVKNMIAARSLLNPFKAIDSKELCGIQMGVEFLHGQVIWRRSEKVSYDYVVDFRPATKHEIAQARSVMRRMKNWSGSYTEEKQIYDGLNNPLLAPKRVKKKKVTRDMSEGIPDTVIPSEKSSTPREISVDDLEMFTN